jgi:hypothetical protein
MIPATAFGLGCDVGREAGFFHPTELTRRGPRFSAAQFTIML